MERTYDRRKRIRRKIDHRDEPDRTAGHLVKAGQLLEAAPVVIRK